jgi:hypothetical protein
MVSTSLEKNFQSESSTFQFVSVALFGFLIGVSWAVYFRFVVRFCMVCGAFQHTLCGVSVSTPWVESVLLRLRL